MSLLCALIANANRDPKKGRPAKIEDFDPYAKADARLNAVVLNKGNFHLLKKAFFGNKDKDKKKEQ
ncbi:MAG: hypothetical protein ABII12_17895 [Planctomycetota bacterium]